MGVAADLAAFIGVNRARLAGQIGNQTPKIHELPFIP
jgi:hypothetical protein